MYKLDRIESSNDFKHFDILAVSISNISGLVHDVPNDLIGIKVSISNKKEILPNILEILERKLPFYEEYIMKLRPNYFHKIVSYAKPEYLTKINNVIKEFNSFTKESMHSNLLNKIYFNKLKHIVEGNPDMHFFSKCFSLNL